jgi:polysaccharide export outer membrane protein
MMKLSIINYQREKGKGKRNFSPIPISLLDTLSFSLTLVLLLVDFSVLAGKGMSQTVTEPPISVPNTESNTQLNIESNSNLRAQLPAFPPTQPPNPGVGNPQSPTPNSPFPILPQVDVPNPNFPPTDTYDLRNPVPPLGYPEQSPRLASPEQFNRYLLGVGDAIGVNVERFTDLNFQGTVDLQGNIIAPLVGKVKILGLSPEAVQDLLQQKFSKFVRNPKVTVVLAGLRPANVTIAGEVLRPGYYSLGPGSPLTSALQAAGGTTNLADLRNVVVRRRSPLDNSIIQQQVDLFTPLQNASELPDMRLRDGDAVVVLKLETGTLTDYDQSLAAHSTLAQTTITLRVLSYPDGRIANLELPNGSNFIDALTALAPSLEEANLREIAVMRFDPEQGKVVTQEINGKRVLFGDLAQNIPLHDEDVIVVGRSLIAKVNYALGFITRPFSTFLDFRSFFKNVGNAFGGSNNNTTGN